MNRQQTDIWTVRTQEDLLYLCKKYGTTDVHTARAAEHFGVTPDQVTQAQRQRAKDLNYLILYGATIKMKDLYRG